MTVPTHLAADDSLLERINATTQRLAAEFTGQFAPETVEDVARKSLQTYEHAVVLDFVPLFVERYTRETLKASISQPRARTLT
jgi:hypothetical protein